MPNRNFRLFILLVGIVVFLLSTAAATLAVSARSAELSPSQQASTPSNTPLTQQTLEQFWQEMYPSAQLNVLGDEENVYTHTLLAKAKPDECFNGIGVPVAITDTVPDCIDGQPKVNEAYVWGLTAYEDTMWFGTAPNVHCLVMGGFLGSTSPIETNSYTCEFGEGPYSPPLPDSIGDWRPPSVYVYDNVSAELTDITPNGLTGYPFDLRFISNTLGIRSAATLGDYVFFAGPAFTPTTSINIFMYNAATQQYLGSRTVLGYGNIRKWLEVDGVLYTAVGTADAGAVLRYTGDPTAATPAERIQFEEVGELNADGAELALHEGRLFVNTWPTCFCGGAVVAGLWMSPLIPDGGLTTADADDWQQVFAYDEYEPDPLIARTYGGGALYSYKGDLYWGTMHVPFLATLTHLGYYADDYYNDDPARPDEQDTILAMLGSQRAITIFKGRNFGTVDQEVEVAYGMPELPAFDPATLTWTTTPTLMGPPLYGLSGFNNMFNNYTWSMSEYDGQLFVGTMDWSYLIDDILQTLLGQIGDQLPIDFEISLPDGTLGADLYRFYATDQPAIAESLNGVGNYSSYGIRNLVGQDDGLYLGMANPMNLLTDLTDDKPEGGWELIRLTRHLIPLTVGLGGNGSGSVVSDLSGIDCGAECSVAYDYGTTIVLTPTADVGSAFTGWSGDCIGLGSCAVTLLDSPHVTANFTLDIHPLTIAIAGDGDGVVSSDPAGIYCGPLCDENYNYGTKVTLTPTVATGSIFTGWSGACSGTATCLLDITSAKEVTATFSNNVFPLVVNIVGDGSGHVTTLPVGIACSEATCSHSFDNGTLVSLSAIAFSGSSFSLWSGACSGTEACEVTITPGTTVVTATFTQNAQQATLNIEGKPVTGSPLTITATLNMSSLTECTWDFGDDTTEDCATPVSSAGTTGVDAVNDVTIQTTHAYAQAGIFVVTVTASNQAGSVVAAQQVTIQVPTAEEPTQQPIDGNLFFPYLNR